jgi:hypothetical protein
MRMSRLSLLLLVPAGSLTAQQVHYEGSLSGATGRYIFTERTSSAAFTNGVSITVGRLSVRASVPIWWQNTVLLTASGAGPVPSGGGGDRSRAVSDTGAARRRRGASGPPPGGSPLGMAVTDDPIPVVVADQFRTALGDPFASATIRVVEGARGSVSLGVGAKIPLADTTQFGTGQWDVGGSASITLRPADRTLIGIDASYWHLGDLASLDFRDPVSGSVSVSHLFRSSWGAMLTAAAATTALSGFAGPASIGAGLTRFRARSSWGVNLSAGLSSTSPDISGGVTWRIGF